MAFNSRIIHVLTICVAIILNWTIVYLTLQYIQECIRDNDIPSLVLTSYEQEFEASNIDRNDLLLDSEDFTRFLTTNPLHYSGF